MDTFWIYFKLGLQHVLDPHGYDHVLFLIALTVPYTFKDWKNLLVLVTVFTLGHTLALVLSVFNVLTLNAEVVEFLIPVTIMVAALYSLFTAGKTHKADSTSAVVIITLFFGLIHGLGFSNYFKSILSGAPTDKLLPLLEFALGIETAQAIVVLVVLIISYIVQHFFRFSKRDWTLTASAFIAGVTLPMILGSEIWG